MDSPSSSLLHPSSSTPPATSQHPSASSTAPQIRSRITVVCAECKRLKLKCDRRTPCGSCTKRDTVVRCIYSPAAAEKVDLHSLNNRLIQVESFISMISSGQQQLPAFQSSYLLPNPSAASSSSTPASSFNLNFSNHHQPSHQHHHHYAPPQSHPSSNSIALSPQDFASIWLDGLDLGVSWLPPSSSPHHQQQLQVYPNGASAGYIKLEPSTIDAALSLPLNGAPTVVDVDNNSHFSQQPSRAASPLNSSSHRRSQQNSSVQLLLPALSIYYPVPTISPPGTSPSSSSAFPHQSSASNTLHLTQQQPQYTKPQVTPALLVLLPSLQRCKRLLHRAREVSHVRPIPFEPTSSNGGGAWKAFEGRCIMLLSGGMTEERERERARKEKAREAKRARQIYFGGIHGLQSDDAEMDDANGTKNKDAEEQSASGEGQSLTFFATMCAVLAIGSYYSSSSGDSNPHATESPAFFYALSQQALGVWDTHVSSTSGSSSSASAAADEAERMDYLLACLVGVEYLMLSRSDEEKEREDDPTTSPVHSLVGRLVNAHRTMGLGKDTSSASRKSKNGLGVPSTVAMSKRLEKEKIKDEWKRMVLWQVMYCDLFTADVLGHQPFIPSYSFSAKLPSCSSSPSSEISIGSAEQELSEDEFQQSHDDMQHDGYDSSFNTRNPNSSRQRHRQQHQQPQSTLPDPNNLEAYEEVHPYLGARYRLTQLAQAVKDRIAHPDCCCGYTLDQAATLEDEIRRWYADLPASLKAALSTASSAATASSSLPPGRTLPRSPFHDLLPSDSTGEDSAGRDFGADKAALAQSCELAIMVNVLIVKIYTPFLRHASSTSATATNGGNATQSFYSASVGGISSSACQATVHAAQAILRAGKVLCAAPSSQNNNPTDGQDVVLPSLFDYYPLDKIIFDAVVICAHAGLTGKAATFAFDAGVLLEDVYSGLELLSDMFAGNGMGVGLGEKQKRVVEALYKRVQHRGGNASLLKRKHDQVDIAGAFSGQSFLCFERIIA
ncbi:hypothetical protein CPB84DRAFT_1707532 [Gymnopilus junonius]|uniref:Zn(2)-C6 fungal-type domain-containing protein n=1 Tax=Gymnopilus junonius TaxID=109634 RepID=A0A9P5TPE6_GYMJU|nr:hypothetical protein CPB84DRAFT_1707532 [Gymnopilus junonius]